METWIEKAAMGNLTDIMSRHVITVEMDDPLSLVETLLEKHQFRHLPVVDEEKKLVGIVSDRDLRAHLTPFLHTPAETARDTSLLHRHAHVIMARHPVAARPDDSIDYGARLLLFNHVSSLPVINEQDHVVGIVTWEDFLCYFTRH